MQKRDIYRYKVKLIMEKVILTESEQNEVTMITEEFDASGGMSTEELIVRLNAITLDEFMNNMSEKIRNYNR